MLPRGLGDCLHLLDDVQQVCDHVLMIDAGLFDPPVRRLLALRSEHPALRPAGAGEVACWLHVTPSPAP